MDICLMAPKREGEYTLAIGCQERHDDDSEYLSNCIKIIQVIKETL